MGPKYVEEKRISLLCYEGLMIFRGLELLGTGADRGQASGRREGTTC